MSFKSIGSQVVLYLRENPGSVSLLASGAVLAGSKLGLHLTVNEVLDGGAVLVPALVAYFKVANTAHTKAVVNAPFSADAATAGDFGPVAVPAPVVVDVPPLVVPTLAPVAAPEPPPLGPGQSA